MSAPLISVLLPVYNAESFIRDSIQSVLDQTLPDFELIVIDDGSKDNSAEMVESIRDPRIRFYRQENKGMGATLNYAISLARGQFLARQDADDISLAERFARQVTFLNAHTDHALAGTAAVIVNEKLGETGRRHSPAEKHRDLCFDLLFDNPFVHSSVMMRADAIKQTGAYDLQKASLIQDYDLWWRIAQKFRVANIPETLVLYREVTSSISRITVNYAETVAKQSAENILDLLKRDGQELNAGEIQQLHEFCLLYHCAFDALPVQPAQNSILRIARRIEKATRKLSQDFSLQRASIHFDRLAKCRRDYRISHRSTPVLTRVWLQAMRKFSTN